MVSAKKKQVSCIYLRSAFLSVLFAFNSTVIHTSEVLHVQTLRLFMAALRQHFLSAYRDSALFSSCHFFMTIIRLPGYAEARICDSLHQSYWSVHWKSDSHFFTPFNVLQTIILLRVNSNITAVWATPQKCLLFNDSKYSEMHFKI